MFTPCSQAQEALTASICGLITVALVDCAFLLLSAPGAKPLSVFACVREKCVCARVRINAHFRERVHVHVCVCVYVCLLTESVYTFICVYLWAWVWDMCADACVCVCVHLRTSAAVACKHTQILLLFLTILSPRWPPPPARFLVPLDVTQENYMAWRCTGRDYLSRSPSSCCSFTFSIFATLVSVGLQCVCVCISQ